MTSISRKRKIALINIINELNEVFDDDNKKEKSRKPRGPTGQFVKDRSIKGAYVTLVRDLELGDTVGFREYTRMDLRTFWEIVKFDRSRNKQK